MIISRNANGCNDLFGFLLFLLFTVHRYKEPIVTIVPHRYKEQEQKNKNEQPF